MSAYNLNFGKKTIRTNLKHSIFVLERTFSVCFREKCAFFTDTKNHILKEMTTDI